MADEQTLGIGYQGNLGFWGTQGNTSPWWNQDMSDAGQALYMDPQTGLQTGIMPEELLAQYRKATEDARKSRGGFMSNIGMALQDLGTGVDSVLSNIPGWGVTKEVVSTAGKIVWWPIDKLASGAHWLYSEAISQPVSTLFLQMAKSEINHDWGSFFEGDEWSDAYGRAEHISPGQAFTNYENVMAAQDEPGMLASIFGGGAENLSKKQREAVKRNGERFLYDTDFWRKTDGWSYTVGTGALDFTFAMGADPVYFGVKTVSSGVKAGRSLQLTTAPTPKSNAIFGGSVLADKLGTKIGEAFAKTPEEASRSTRVNNFFDWADGKSAAEIAQHPIWGRGRRANPEKYRLAETFAHTPREDMPLVLRLAAGDNNAAVQMAQKSQDNVIRLGKLQESRVLVDSVKFEPEMLQHFITEERAGRAALAGEKAGLTGVSEPIVAGKLVEPPYPRPTTPGPRQEGWDKTYGALAAQSQVYRQAAGEISKLNNGVRPMSGAAATSQADVLRAQEWKANQLDLINTQIDELSKTNAYYGSVLGNLGKNPEDFSPGESNIFGTMTSLYRQGPMALRDVERAAEKKITRMSTGVKDYGKVGKDEAGFVSRVIRNGFYAPAVRVINSFGDRMPSTFIDHNAEDAFERVSEMVKRVPGLDQEVRLGMITAYSQAGDKVARSEQLNKIHTGIIEHMASKYDLDLQASRVIDNMIRDGKISTMSKLTGQVPNSQMFSAAGTQPGMRADMVEDGDSLIVSPLAKTQLSTGDPLLDIKELDRFLKRNSGLINSLRASGAGAADAVAAVGDSLNTIWKAATLLRPGYVLRSMSEEQAASAVKFGVMSSIINSAQGGANWALNRGQQVKALIGKGSYASTVNPTDSVVRILDEAGVKAAESQGLATERINVSKAWPVINARISYERESITELESLIARERKADAPDQAIIDDLTARIEDHNNVIGEFGDYAKAILAEAKDSKGRRLGEGVFEHEGVIVPQAFSTKWENPIPRDQITSAKAMETIFARSEAVDMNRLMATGSWKTIAPDAEDMQQASLHMSAWLQGLNRQYGQDPLFRLVAEDPTLAKARAWLNTGEGKYHRSVLGLQGRDPEQLLSNVKVTLDTYLPPGTGLQAKTARGEEITETDLRSAIAEDDFPLVHGEEFTSLTRKGVINSGAHAIDKMIEKGFKMLATVPNDVMARQPIYLRAQEARMRQLIDQEIGFRMEAGLDDALDPATLNKILEKSDRMARKDISQVVYDPTRTTATEALRFIAPFLSAHADGLSRWAGLIAEKPQFLATAAKIYNAPVAANMVTDQSGNHVDQDGYTDVIDPTTGKVVERKFVPIEERVLNLSMPDGTKNVRGRKNLPIRLSALNTIMPGDPWFNPGTGPFAQIAASEVAKKAPGVGDFLQWAKILPYGPTEGVFDPMVPKYLKDAWNAYTAGEAGNNAYQEAYLQEYQRQMGDYANGGEPPDMDEVAKNAKEFMFLDAFLSWSMPAQNAATPLTGSPYQFFVDQYKVMQEVDPKNAKANFFKKYGSDYFAFTASLSKSMGIQASLSADAMAEKYGDLIAMDPDLAPLIVGDVYNRGEFSMSVYKKQMDQLLGGERVREKMTAEQAIRENQKAMGWQQFNKYSQMLDAELIRSGFRAYNEAGAEPFSQLKQQLVGMIAENNDPWYEDYGTTNTTQLPIRIKAMQRLVEDKEMAKDPLRNDLNGLRFYLAGREELKAALAARGGRQLSFDVDGQPTGTNADIGMQLKSLQLMLVNNNLEFADIFHRYLENDDLS